MATTAQTGPSRRAGRGRMLGLLLAAGLPLSAGAETRAVSIDNFTFSPAAITISPGSTVTWTNADDIPHTVTASDKSFRSGALDTGDHFAFTFTMAGDYVYYCSMHPQMTGKIRVRAP